MRLPGPEARGPGRARRRRASRAARRRQDPPTRAEQRQRGASRSRARRHAHRRGPEYVGGPLATVTHPEVDAPEAVLDLCTARGIACLPYFPLAVGNIGQLPALAASAAAHDASPAQIALAWLLARSPIIRPIPGTSSLTHLEENWDARRIALTPTEVIAIATPA